MLGGNTELTSEQGTSFVHITDSNLENLTIFSIESICSHRGKKELPYFWFYLLPCIRAAVTRLCNLIFQNPFLSAGMVKIQDFICSLALIYFEFKNLFAANSLYSISPGEFYILISNGSW